MSELAHKEVRVSTFRRFAVPALLFLFAALSIGLLVAVNGLDWRIETSLLAGNLVDGASMTKGLAYVLIWLHAWILAPVVALTGIILVLWEFASPLTKRPD